MMFKKKVEGQFKGNTFMVVNSWSDGLKLFHNEELLEHNKDLFSVNKNKPVITKTVVIENKENQVDVYVKAIFTVKIMVKVGGEKIAGDDF